VKEVWEWSGKGGREGQLDNTESEMRTKTESRTGTKSGMETEKGRQMCRPYALQVTSQTRRGGVATKMAMGVHGKPATS
jgi:hypothetical protein